MTRHLELPLSGLRDPLRGENGQPFDVVFLDGLTGETLIGVRDDELNAPQTIVIDISAGLRRARACTSDCIADTIDYGGVRDRVHRLMREHRCRLLEAFAETLTAILLNEFGAVWARVKVVKPRKFADVAAVGVLIERYAAPVAVNYPRAST